MQVIVVATENQKAQLAECDSSITWVDSVDALTHFSTADAFVDLSFELNKERIALLAALLPKPVVINSVASTLENTHPAFVRINGWNSFLASSTWEATCINEKTRPQAEAVFTALGKKAEWLPDSPGFVTARVVSMIINEAFLALEEGVSTRDEINTAMKLGTAYPYGPFEWAEKIGMPNVVQLLEALSRIHPRYT
ncbi:MAG: 3-hydroxyacyl-CoA dehydrogenase family protein, partial [Bacteroidota bacterium]|nr:3-hydroxyacyl-CoA dehydrogenase family protein [Bacteroidota bacterium]